MESNNIAYDQKYKFIIENINILYSLSAILTIYLDFYNYKVQSIKYEEVSNKNRILSILLIINIIFTLCFIISGINIINASITNYKQHIFNYAMLLFFQVGKTMLYINNYSEKQIIYTNIFQIIILVLNVISIKLIIKYKNLSL